MALPSFPIPPATYLRAFRALLGMKGSTLFSRAWGCYRNDDVTNLTHHGCDGRKLRQLSEWDRDLVCREDWKIEGRRFRVYWLNPDYPGPAIGRNLNPDGTGNPPAVAPRDVRITTQSSLHKITTTTPGRLFDLQPIGRPE